MATELGAGGARYAHIPRQGPAESHPATEALRARYEAYRQRQGRDLLAIVPREGVRALVRQFRAGQGEAVRGEPTLEQLAAHCAELLPLPPFGAWLEDFHLNRGAYLVDVEPPLAEGPAVPGGEPVTVDVRTFVVASAEWVAALCVHPVEEGWRGAIQFHRPPERDSVRTADIFREEHLTPVRERFRSFDEATLRAFLRSALP